MEARDRIGQRLVSQLSLVAAVAHHLDPLQPFWGHWVNSKDRVPSGGVTLGERKTDIAAIVKRQEKDPIGLPLQEAAQTDIEAFLVSLDSPPDGGMNDKGDALALANLFYAFETQHG
jgi:hypothetical protein